jgi:hypothetical protein
MCRQKARPDATEGIVIARRLAPADHQLFVRDARVNR